mmetsp:Transcript_3993/g.11099  ORF Transcript_3993/g.11099 Transcript_3993/m.11099 type:complete len:244 (-) Transcript_3993:72-803(-)
MSPTPQRRHHCSKRNLAVAQAGGGGPGPSAPSLPRMVATSTLTSPQPQSAASAPAPRRPLLAGAVRLHGSGCSGSPDGSAGGLLGSLARADHSALNGPSVADEAEDEAAMDSASTVALGSPHAGATASCAGGGATIGTGAAGAGKVTSHAAASSTASSAPPRFRLQTASKGGGEPWREICRDTRTRGRASPSVRGTGITPSSATLGALVAGLAAGLGVQISSCPVPQQLKSQPSCATAAKSCW